MTYEELILCALDRVLGLEERKSNEQPPNNVQCQLRHQVRWFAPVGGERPLDQSLGLVRPRFRKLRLESCTHWWMFASFFMKSLNVGFSSAEGLRLKPNVVPVAVADSRSTSTDDVKHEFSPRSTDKGMLAVRLFLYSRILAGSALPRAPCFEIFDNRSGVLAYVAKIHRLTAFL